MGNFDLTPAAVAAILAMLGHVPGRPRRAVGRGPGCLVLVQVWVPDGPMPTVLAPPPPPPRTAGRVRCRADVTAAVGRAGRPLALKEVLAALAADGREHSRSAVTKALAELVAEGELTNPRDGQGYRPAGWRPPPPARPGLFDR